MSRSSDAPKLPLLSDGTYLKLKTITTMVLPAAVTLYIALAQVWHLSKVEEVVGTLASVNAFLGALVAFSTKSYNNGSTKYAGEIQVTDNGAKKTATLVVNGDPEDILALSEATFKINDTVNVN